MGHCDSTQLYPPPPSSPSVVTHVVPLLDYRKHSFITAIKMARFLAESVERPVLLPGKSETRGNSISPVGKWEMAASHFPRLLLLFFLSLFFYFYRRYLSKTKRYLGHGLSPGLERYLLIEDCRGRIILVIQSYYELEVDSQLIMLR